MQLRKNTSHYHLPRDFDSLLSAELKVGRIVFPLLVLDGIDNDAILIEHFDVVQNKPYATRTVAGKFIEFYPVPTRQYAVRIVYVPKAKTC